MTSRTPSFRARLAALLVPLVIMPATGGLHAQTPPSYPAIADADPVAALSRYLRMLAANPRDLASLTGAGRAALAVGDANAALGFYARAEEIAPRNGRIKAGLASALVQMEQPRTALKLFDEAVALGVPVGEIASDRGLANDLNGDNRRAQADYTLALRAKDDDEVLRRLALSMAISGDRAGALTMLDPLLRKRDSGAVRARAFVLALTGDQAGAANVVRGAMPGPQATVMANFMSRLGKLNPAQKALAVNFGYFPSDGRSYSAAELFADARSGAQPIPGAALPARDPRSERRADTPLIPAGEALGPAIVTASGDPAARGPRRRPGQLDAAEILPPQHVLSAPIPGQMAAPSTVPTRISPAMTTRATAVTTGDLRAGLVQSVRPAVGPTVAATSGVGARAPAVAMAPATVAPATTPAPALAQAQAVAVPITQAPTTPVAAPAAETAVSQPAERAAGDGALIVTAMGPALTSSVAERAPAPTIATVDLPASRPARTVIAAPAAPVHLAARPAAKPKTQLALRDEQDEPAPAKAHKPAPKSAPDPDPAAKSSAKGKGAADKDTDKPDAKGKAGRDKAGKDKAGKPDAEDKAGTKRAANDKTRDPATDKDAKGGKGDKTRTADKGKAGDKKGADKDKADGKSADKGRDKVDGKSADKGRDKTDAKASAKSKIPERYWVQVASGSNKANLDKAWTAVKGKAPKLLEGKSTYTAPWHASNRLLIGPFKTDEEAQAQVNKLAKSGVSGIQFTTRAGNDVEKVTAR